ncbi:MAG TPA: PIG-L family deacetylase [Candidatus Tectomicrobia bacterium]|nr:PIG-L family deacetylase [Candidatus Tectomicrobia bacterium]
MRTLLPFSWRHQILRLVICTIIFGVAALFALESPAQLTSAHKDSKAFLRGWDVAKDRVHSRLGSARWLIVVIVGCLLGAARPIPYSSPATAAPAGDNLPGTSTAEPAGSLVELIYRLPVYVSVLHTAAHPDDENNALLAYLARGVFARTAYLSLTRGDGGQNRIGPELFEALGIIRTEELLAARRVDGAEQFFTSAYDFGFSKSADETLAKWGREEILADIVRVIRTFRPDVIISRFAGTPSDGHGHHQAAGILTREAFFAAADPNRFPQQIAEGLQPWQAAKLFWNEFRSWRGSAPAQPAGEMSVDVGAYSPLLERTYHQLGLKAQNLHRSQLPPRLPRYGKHLDGFRRLDVEGSSSSKGLFDGMDLTLHRVADVVPEGSAARDRLRAALQEIQTIATTAAERFRPWDPSAVVPLLLQGYERIRRLRALLRTWELDVLAADRIDYALSVKEREFRTALERSLGLQIEAVVATQNAVRGGTLSVSVTMFNHSPRSIALEFVGLKAPAGWQVDPPPFQETLLTPQQGTELAFQVGVPEDAVLTQPYWLESPRLGERFSVADHRLLVYPFAPPLLSASWRWRIHEDGFSAVVDSARAVEFPLAGHAAGDVRQPVRVVPELSLTLEPPLLIAPLTDHPLQKQLNVTVVGNVAGDTILRLQAPVGWNVDPAEHRIALAAGQEATRRFSIQIPASTAAGRFRIHAVANFRGKQFSRGYRAIAYPHIRSHLLYREALTNVEVFRVDTAPGLSVGYVMGAGDTVPGAIEQLGIGVSLLSPEDLASADLSRYDTIMVGARAYEFRPDLVANQQRLMDYVRDGGTVIVQYQTLAAEGITFTPYPAKLSRARVVDETAPVTILDPAHPLFRWPNRITEQDFDGWVQERGLYFLEQWHERFMPLLESHDADEPPQRGGMVIARYGKGRYIYTGYAWFRQLPAGVPGAFRMFANLLSLPRAK